MSSGPSAVEVTALRLSALSELVVECNMEYNDLLTPLPVGEGGLYRVRCPPQRFRYRGGVVAIECVRYM